MTSYLFPWWMPQKSAQVFSGVISSPYPPQYDSSGTNLYKAIESLKPTRSARGDIVGAAKELHPSLYVVPPLVGFAAGYDLPVTGTKDERRTKRLRRALIGATMGAGIPLALLGAVARTTAPSTAGAEAAKERALRLLDSPWPATMREGLSGLDAHKYDPDSWRASGLDLKEVVDNLKKQKSSAADKAQRDADAAEFGRKGYGRSAMMGAGVGLGIGLSNGIRTDHYSPAMRFAAIPAAFTVVGIGMSVSGHAIRNAIARIAASREERVPRDKRALCAAEVEEAGSVVPKRLTLRRRQSGRYRKGQVEWNGLKISIETPAGHWRIGKKPNGKLWMVKMRNAYGYIQRVKGYDGDGLDVFLGPHLESNLVFVINQNKPGTKEFDEHKVMIGWLTEAEARIAYLANYTKDWKGYAGCVKMTADEFKAWARSDASAGRAKAADARWLMPAALGITGLGVDYAVNAGMRRSADTRAAAVGVMTPEQRTALNHASPGQSVMEVPGLKSPTYVSREDIETQLGAGLPLRRTAERQGLVLFDPQSTPAAYYAHELAHRDVPSWARSDTFSPLARGLANAASYGPGVYAGLASGRPLAGAAVGAMARLIGRSPAILEEFFAMRRAKQLIDYMPGTPEEKKLQRSALSRAFMTYIIPPVTSGAITGAAAGYAGRLMP